MAEAPKLTRYESRRRPNLSFEVLLDGKMLQCLYAKTAENALKRVAKHVPAADRQRLIVVQL